MNRKERDEARRICEAATPGPFSGGNLGSIGNPSKFMGRDEAVRWFRSLLAESDDLKRPTAYVERGTGDLPGDGVIAIFGNGPKSYDNAVFWAHARTALPAALDETDRLELEIAAARHALNLSIPSGTVDAWIETARLDLGAP